jgi:hypothetical protein
VEEDKDDLPVLDKDFPVVVEGDLVVLKGLAVVVEALDFAASTKSLGRFSAFKTSNTSYNNNNSLIDYLKSINYAN